MTPRERTLAVVLLVLLLLIGGGAGGYFFVYLPVAQKRDAAAKLQQEITDLEAKRAQAGKDRPRLAEARKRSLPADLPTARREYAETMSRLLTRAGAANVHVDEVTSPDTTGTPLLAAKKPAYTKVTHKITFEKADMWVIHDFLLAYYRLGLLHQIAKLDIKTEATQTGSAASRGKVATDRRDLAVELITEAIVLDEAENRRTLLPVANAFAGVGGLAGLTALTLSPEAGRGLTPLPFAPVLSPKNRDYTLLVRNDIFHGPLPPLPPLTVEKIADVAADLDEPLAPVKVKPTGDFGPAGKVTLTATADGKLFPAGGIKVDQAARTITLTPAKGQTGEVTVTVTAKTEDGMSAKTRFDVTVKEKDAKKLPDIAGSIRLVIVSADSDGTARAVIRDNFNPHTYEVEATKAGVKVVKYELRGGRMKLDLEYRASGDRPRPKPLLEITDDGVSSTKRTFKVVAIDTAGLVLLDKTPPPEVKPAADAKPRPGPRDKPDPLAAVVGGAAGAKPAPGGDPVLYLWATGKPLSALTAVPKDEAKKILQRSAEAGPVGATTVAASGE